MHEFSSNERRTHNLLAMFKEKALPENYLLIDSFVKDRQVTNNTKLSSFRSHLDALRVLTEVYPMKRLKDLTEQDLKEFIAIMKSKTSARGKPYSEVTIWNFKRMTRFFFKWLGKLECVAWIRKTNGQSNVRIPEKIITPTDLLALIRNCKSVQEQAVVTVLFDSGCRAAEFLGMDIEDFEFNQGTCQVMVAGKSGKRIIPLFKSLPYLQRWLDLHPTKKGPLWINSTGQCCAPSWLGRFLEDLGLKSGLNYRLYPHLMRKSRLTELSTKVTEQTLKVFAGWSKTSQMTKHYVFMSQEQVNKALAIAEGQQIPQPVNESQELTSVDCIFCKQKNPVTAMFCFKCGRVLKEETGFKAGQERLVADEVMNRFLTEALKDSQIKEKLGRLLNEVMIEKR